MPALKAGLLPWLRFWLKIKGGDFKHNLTDNKQNPLLNGEDFA